MASGNSRDYYDDSETRTPRDQEIKELIDNIADNFILKVRQSVEAAKGRPKSWNQDENDRLLEEDINKIVNTITWEDIRHSQIENQSSSYSSVFGESRDYYDVPETIPQGDPAVEELINTITGAAKEKVRQQVHAVIQQYKRRCSCGKITHNYEWLVAKIGAVIRKAIHTLIEVRELLEVQRPLETQYPNYQY